VAASPICKRFYCSRGRPGNGFGFKKFDDCFRTPARILASQTIDLQTIDFQMIDLMV
jgi:hypothetical protein